MATVLFPTIQAVLLNCENGNFEHAHGRTHERYW